MAKRLKAVTLSGMTPSGIVVFPSVFEHESKNDGSSTGKYKCTFLFDISDPAVKDYVTKVQKECIKLACVAFECKDRKQLEEEKIRWNPFLKATGKQIESWGDVYTGKVFIRTSTKFEFDVVGRRKEALDDTTFYPGCLARMSQTTLGHYAVDGNSGVSIYLSAIQKTAEGERLGGGGGSSADGFEALDDGDDTGLDQFDTVVEEVEDDMFA